MIPDQIPIGSLLMLLVACMTGMGFLVALLVVAKRFQSYEKKSQGRASFMAVQELGAAETGGPDADLKRAMSAVQRNDNENAEAICDRILRESSGHPGALFLRAQLYFASERRDQGMADCEAVILQSPEHWDAWLLLARAHLELEHMEKAREILDKCPDSPLATALRSRCK